MHQSCISLIHPTGNPNSREAARALSETNLLKDVITTIAYNPESPKWQYLNVLPQKIRDSITYELGRRIWMTPGNVPVKTHLWQELIRVLLVRTRVYRYAGLSSQRLADWIYLSLDRHVAKHHLSVCDAVYAYEDGAATTFQEAKKQGILCFYDLPIPFYQSIQEIIREEAQLFPDLASVLETNSPAWKLERKEQEVQLADHIFVASHFTYKSLLCIGIEPEKISIIAYGSPSDYFQPFPKKDKQFRALYVGQIKPHKGTHYLLQAWQELQLHNAELLLVGKNLFPQGWLNRYTDVFRHVPSVPHVALNQYYSSANVLVFPSLFEGFGLVLLEAMACGIPVITTFNVGGKDILTDGIEGFIVPIRDVEALKEKLEWCYRHPQELAEMGQAARQKAEQLTWNLYRQNLASRAQEILDNQTR